MVEIDENIRQQLKLSSAAGVLIYETFAGSAAQEAGLQRGDVILTFDGTPVSGPSALRVLVNDRRPGDTVVIEYERDGQKSTAEVSLKEF